MKHTITLNPNKLTIPNLESTTNKIRKRFGEIAAEQFLSEFWESLSRNEPRIKLSVSRIKE